MSPSLALPLLWGMGPYQANPGMTQPKWVLKAARPTPAGPHPLPAYASPSARLHSAEWHRTAEFSGGPAEDAPATKRECGFKGGRGLGCPHSPCIPGVLWLPTLLVPSWQCLQQAPFSTHPQPHRHHHTLRHQNQAHPHHLHYPSANASSRPYTSTGSTDTADISTIPHTAFNMDHGASTCLSGPQNNVLRREVLQPIP